MKEKAEIILGFAFSRRGCPCNGTPLIFTKQVDGAMQTLTIWDKRQVWQLKTRGCVIATGNAENMVSKIQHIWEL